METQQLRFGIDRCPATRNMSHPLHCKDCDFKGSCDNEYCECKFFKKVQVKELQKTH